MYVVIIGGGEVGSYIAHVLVEEHHDVVVIERDADVAARLTATLDALVIEGSGVSPPILAKAGLERADLFLAVTPIDEVNLVACMIARKHGRREMRTVAMVKQSHYTGTSDAFDADDLDAVDALVHTEQAIASIAMGLLRYAGSGELRELAGGKLVLVGMLLGHDSPLVHETLASVRPDLPKDSLVVAVEGDDGIRIPTGADILKHDERAYMLTLPKHLTELTILSGHPWRRVERVLLIGVGNTGLALARQLEAGGFRPTLLERDSERAEKVAALLPKSTVLHGDGSDPDLLRRVIDDNRIDAVVVLLKDPERSLLLGLFARSLEARKVIVRCDKAAYEHLAHKLGIDAVISRNRAVANATLRYVMRGRVESTLMLGEHDLEVIDFRIPDAPARRELTELPISKLDLPEGVLVGAIVRDNNVFIATGDTILKPRDEVFVVCKPDRLARVETLLS